MAILNRLKKIYPTNYIAILNEIDILIKKWKSFDFKNYEEITQNDVCLITYGDAFYQSGEMPLETLRQFHTDYLKDIINIIHILPMFPYSSDDGFSVIDFRIVDPNLGNWTHLLNLQKQVDLMYDAVLNHVSVKSDYFKNYLDRKNGFKDFFIAQDPHKDFSKVTRPRTSPLLTPFETKDGIKHVWTTFSADQVDLNYEDPKVLLEILDVLLFYVSRGARFIRFDAIGFLWKKDNSSCMHLEETHEIVKLMREVIDLVATGVKIITETNVKHAENISYFGNGSDEASLVYQFPLPPLVLHAFQSENSDYLSHWLENLEPTQTGTTFFNFLSSHDGIGVRPVEGLLPENELKKMIQNVIDRGGKINYRKVANKEDIPYEMCITYLDALNNPYDSSDIQIKRMVGAITILLSLQGMPAIYYHSLLGSHNDYEGYETSKINRRINREKLEYSKLKTEMNDQHHFRNHLFEQLKKRIEIRKNNPLFHPDVSQSVIRYGNHVFALERNNGNDQLITVVNLSNEIVKITIDHQYHNLLTGEQYLKEIVLEPLASGWFQKIQNGS